jgi:hypothetical protein
LNSCIHVRILHLAKYLLIITLLFPGLVTQTRAGNADLAKAAQNPVTDLISL